ncbi:MAG: hypothetical protein GF341_05125, partial [candidate division Zixibacteria bacterium]|nr:hypothetical protein [candidate division Zixibacteria bacterium]
MRRQRHLLTITILVGITMCATVPTMARTIDVIFEQGTIRVEGDRYNGVEYVNLRGLLDAFDARIEWDSTAQRLRADLDGRIWVFW